MANKKVFTNESLATFIEETKQYVDNVFEESKVFYTTATTEDFVNATLDKTFMEIQNAYLDNKTMLCKFVLGEEALLMSMSGFTVNSYVMFSAITAGQMFSIILDSNNTGTFDYVEIPSLLQFENHTENSENPHGVTLSQLGVNATATELNYVDGVTSNIQTQLDEKAQVQIITWGADD